MGHANYVHSNPAADARLAKSPTDIRIAFSEKPDPKGSDIVVLNETGTRFDRRDVTASDEPNGLRVSVGTLGEGGYLVAWTVVSAVDGHRTKGTFAFAIGNAPLPSIPDVPNASPAPTALEIAGRVLSFGGVALGLGLFLFGFLVTNERTARGTRYERIVFVAAGTMLVLSTAFLMLDQGNRLPARLGLLLSTRAISGLALVALQFTPALFPSAARRLVTGAAAIAAALTLTLVSHAAAYESAKEIALDLVHVAAISSWIGGLVGLLIVVMPNAPKTDEGLRTLGHIVWRFSIVAISSVAVIVASGTLASLDRLVLVEDLWETPYGLALSTKIVLLTIVLGLAALNLLRFGPQLRRSIDAVRAQRRLRRGVLGETALLVCVLVAASFLTAFAPPAERNPGYNETRHIDGLRLKLLVPNPSPGRGRYILRVHEGLTPIVRAEKVALVFTMIEHDMGQTELVMQERAPGEYAVEGSPTAMTGTWRIEAVVRRTGREDVRTIFTVPISVAVGAGTARAIAAGPYTAIVFLDPSTAIAGAPLALNIVLSDATGNPVSGKTPTLTIQGSGSTQNLAATAGGPGRYVFTFTGLDAGTWQATVALGDAAFSYGFEVVR